MNSLTRWLGVWSSGLAAFTFLLFILCFVAIIATQPLFLWTDLADFVTYRQAHGELWATIAQSAMLCFGPLFLVLLNCIYATTPADQKLLVRIAICMGIGFAVLTGLHYFVQISAVRVNLAHGELDGVKQLLQANPYSASSAANMLGWTLFFGNASLLVAPVFYGSRRRRMLRRLFWINGICCLLAGVGYVFEWTVLVFATINLGMGGAVMALTLLLAFEFAGQRTGT